MSTQKIRNLSASSIAPKDTSSSVHRQIGGFKSLGWTTFQAWLGLATEISLLIILSHFIKPAEFGLYAISFGIVSVLTLIASAGFGPAIVIDNKSPMNSAQTALTISFLISLALIALTLVSAPLLINNFETGAELITLCYWLLPLLILIPMRTIRTALLQRAHAFDQLAKIEMIALLSKFSFSVLAGALGFGPMALVLGQLGYWGTASVTIFLKTNCRLGFQYESAKSLLNFSLGFMWLQIIDQLMSILDRFIVFHLSGPQATGFYQRSVAVRTIGSSIALAPMDHLCFPRFARVSNEHSSLTREFNYAQSLGLMFSLPLSISIFVAAPEWTPILFGPNWEPAGTLIQTMALVLPFRALDRTMAILARSLNRQALRFAIHLALLISTMSVLYFLLSISLEIAVAAMAATFAAMSLPSLAVSAHLLQSSFKHELQRVLPVIGLGGAVLGLAVLAKYALMPLLPIAAASLIAAALASTFFIGICALIPALLFPAEVATIIVTARKNILFNGFRIYNPV